jgi:hypothetical protein
VEAALENVKLRWENAILLDRLRAAVSQLAILEQEMEQGWDETGSKDKKLQERMTRVREAVSRLDRLSNQLNRLRERAKGVAAQVIELMGEEVDNVAGILDEK